MKETKHLHEQIQTVMHSRLTSEYPIYGMVIQETEESDPEKRVVYIGKNQHYSPLKPGLDHDDTDYGGWRNWKWLSENRPVMCSWDGEIDYELDPLHYDRRADNGLPSDVSNSEYNGNAMAVIPKIYSCSYILDQRRYVYFCEERATEDFQAAGFSVRGLERDFMLIPMFYGSKDEKGRLRSIAGQWSAGTISGHHTQNRDGMDMDTAAQYKAVLDSSPKALFFGGAIVNILTDLAVMLAKTTDTQSAYGSGMSSSFTSDSDSENHWGTEKNPLLNRQFCGGTDGHSFSNLFHSCVPGSNMLWQRDPYMILEHGKLKVSPDYIFDLSGESYRDTGCVFQNGGYFAQTKVIPDFGFVSCPGMTGSETAGYCDHIYANPAVVSIASRFGCCRSGLRAGLFARSMNHSGFNKEELLENGAPLNTARELDESFSWWWNFGCSLMLPGPVSEF